jgi:diguanylate cyclase
VHALKIDRSFVSEMAHSEASHKIVKGMVRMAHSLQMVVIAEGAETPEQIEMLKRLRCEVVQGYGYGRPMALDKFLEFARAHQLPGPAMSALTI